VKLPEKAESIYRESLGEDGRKEDSKQLQQTKPHNSLQGVPLFWQGDPLIKFAFLGPKQGPTTTQYRTVKYVGINSQP